MDNIPEKMCKCSHHKAAPLLVVVFGLVFLLGALDILSPKAVNITWPVVVMLVGFVKFSGGMCKCYAEKHW